MFLLIMKQSSTTCINVLGSRLMETLILNKFADAGETALPACCAP